MKNAYPEKPSLTYQQTSVPLEDVINYLRSSDTAVEIKRAAFCFFRLESANGKKGINNNYAGIQADGYRWPAIYDDKIAGTVLKKENGELGHTRIFIAFNSWRDSVFFTLDNAKRRGLYIGGTTFRITHMNIITPQDLCNAYKREWVTGNANYVSDPVQEIKPFVALYKNAVTLFASFN